MTKNSDTISEPLKQKMMILDEKQATYRKKEEKMRLNLIEMQEDLSDMSKHLKLLLDTLNNVNDTDVRKFNLMSSKQKKNMILDCVRTIVFLLLIFIVIPFFIVIPLYIYAITHYGTLTFIAYGTLTFIAIVIISFLVIVGIGIVYSEMFLITSLPKEFKKINISECKDKATDTLDLIESCRDVVTLALKEETLSKDTYSEIYSNAKTVALEYLVFKNELT